MDASGPIRPEERFDEERAAGYLQEQLPGLLGGSDVVFEQFHGGRANLTYLVRSGDAEVVLRRPPLGPLAPGSHDMAREYRVLSVLHEAFPEAPRAYHLCTDPSIIGAEFFVMERRRGHVVRAGWPSELDGSAGFKRQLGDGMIDTLVRLHSVDYRRIGLGDLGRPDGFLKRQVAGWTDRWERAKHEDVDAMTELAGRFAEEIPAPQIDAILQNDYRFDNGMVAGAGRVEAVFV